MKKSRLPVKRPSAWWCRRYHVPQGGLGVPRRRRAAAPDPSRHRRAVIAAALAIWGKPGRRMSLYRLVRVSGVSAGTIYREFGSMEGLLLSVCENYVAGLVAVVERADLPELSGRRRLEAVALALCNAIAAAPDAHRVWLLGELQTSPRRWRDVGIRFEWIVALFGDAVEGALVGVEAGSPIVAAAVRSLLVILFDHPAWWGDASPDGRVQFVRFVVNAVLGGLRAELGRVVEA